MKPAMRMNIFRRLSVALVITLLVLPMLTAPVSCTNEGQIETVNMPTTAEQGSRIEISIIIKNPTSFFGLFGSHRLYTLEANAPAIDYASSTTVFIAKGQSRTVTIRLNVPNYDGEITISFSLYENDNLIDIKNKNLIITEPAVDVAGLQAELQSLQANYHSLSSRYASLQSQLDYYRTRVSNLESRLDRILDITVRQNYDWDYTVGFWSENYEWELSIPLSLYVNYYERARPTSYVAWANMAKDPQDDDYIDQMVQQINNAAIKEGFTEIQKVNFVVAFVQSLPYTTDSVTTPWNEYPRYPIETLFDRGGDCEDTSILVAALLDRLGYDVAILILPYENHAAVGISIYGGSGSYYIKDGTKYYYLETTGDGWEIGDMPSSFTDRRAYIYPL